MRTQTEVEGKEVLAVYTKKACELISVTPAAFTLAVRKSGLGRTQIKKHFLKEGCGSAVVCVQQRSDNTVNRSCCAIFLKEIPADICSTLKMCKFLTYTITPKANLHGLCVYHFLVR